MPKMNMRVRRRPELRLASGALMVSPTAMPRPRQADGGECQANDVQVAGNSARVTISMIGFPFLLLLFIAKYT